MGDDLSNLRAMVIDDIEYVVKVTKELLEALGVEVVATASDGSEALRILGAMADPPDVILCDLSMPGMDGIQFIRHLAEREIRSALLLVSGEESGVLRTVEAMARSHNLYVLGVLTKPLHIEAAEKMLRAYTAETFPSRHSAQAISLAELDAGIKGDAVSLLYQPKVDALARKVHGVEALARWNHPVRGLLEAATFIPMAEETGRIDALTEVIFQKAMRQAGEWNAIGMDLSMAVNLSVDNLNRLELPEFIVSNAMKEGVHPSKVILEITESRVMKNLKTCLETLSRLRLKGVSLAIDDFGTGYSSLEQLKRSPFNEIKIDRAFVFGAADDPAARAILESSVALGKKLKLTVVAEGAETQADLNTACGAGCDLIQGFVVAKPMPANLVAGWLRDWENASSGWPC